MKNLIYISSKDDYKEYDLYKNRNDFRSAMSKKLKTIFNIHNIIFLDFDDFVKIDCNQKAKVINDISKFCNKDSETIFIISAHGEKGGDEFNMYPNKIIKFADIADFINQMNDKLKMEYRILTDACFFFAEKNSTLDFIKPNQNISFLELAEKTSSASNLYRRLDLSNINKLNEIRGPLTQSSINKAFLDVKAHTIGSAKTKGYPNVNANKFASLAKVFDFNWNQF